jgi:hypothetical protein
MLRLVKNKGKSVRMKFGATLWGLIHGACVLSLLSFSVDLQNSGVDANGESLHHDFYEDDDDDLVEEESDTATADDAARSE